MTQYKMSKGLKLFVRTCIVLFSRSKGVSYIMTLPVRLITENHRKPPQTKTNHRKPPINPPQTTFNIIVLHALNVLGFVRVDKGRFRIDSLA